MNTVKNFIYNISDILVALLIITAAVLIIGWRVNTIMDYPSRVAALQTEQSSDSAQAGSEADGSTAGQTSSAADTSAAPVTVTVIPNSTVDDIAATLVSAGVISAPEEFVSAVEAAGAATKLKYGTYTIPAGVAMDQIIQMMTS